jgi:hypothetical protein
MKKTIRVDLAFIDGEHTYNATLSDFDFCLRVINDDGIILFHDFYIIYPAIRKILKSLDRPFRAIKLEDNMFGLFFGNVTSPYLLELESKTGSFWIEFSFKNILKRILPRKAIQMAKTLLRRFVSK